MRYSVSYVAESKTLELAVSPDEGEDIDSEFLMRFVGLVTAICPADVSAATSKKVLEVMGATPTNG